VVKKSLQLDYRGRLSTLVKSTVGLSRTEVEIIYRIEKANHEKLDVVQFDIT